MIDAKLVCACGNEHIHGQMRERYPLAPEPFWRCLSCGAGTWDSQIGDDTTIRWVAVVEEGTTEA